MAFGFLVVRSLCRESFLAAVSAWLAFVLVFTLPALAERTTFRTYGTEQGLASTSGGCMVQDHAGFLLVCSEHGVFAYDGRRFINLGTDQGLREGGLVEHLALTSAGRIAVGYPDEVFISDRAPDTSHPPRSLSFRPVLHPGLSFYSQRLRHMAPWRGSLVLLAGETAIRIVVPEAGPPRVETMGYAAAEQRLLERPTAVFSVSGRLWDAFGDSRLCAADPGAVKCYTAANGLSRGPWMDMVAGNDGQVLARSLSSVATFDPGSDRWSSVALPDQGGRYENYPGYLGLFRTPDGGLITQADHGLVILRPGGWRTFSVEDGAPSGNVAGAMTDATGQLWFQIPGRGLVRWLGYGHWEILQKSDGLSDGIPWQSVRPPGGSVWVSTDSGLDEIVRRGPLLRVGRVFPGPFFALAVGLQGEIWSSFGLHGARIFNPLDGSSSHVDVPPVNAIVPDGGGTVWLGTEAGLFRVDDHPGAARRAIREGSLLTPVADIACDGSGGVFYLSGGRLRHRRQSGTDVAVDGPWPADGFGALTLAVDHDAALWLGGPGGLYRFVLSNDHVSSYQAIPTSDTRTNTIVAVMVDRRGWVWAGTELGVSVFNGERWVSVDSNGGLLSDDVAEGGLREDPDGSVWIATTEGFSHLLDPAWLFSDQPLGVMVSEARLGSRPVVGDRMPYTRRALSLEFGTPTYSVERSVLFHYRLSGVDAGWVDSSSGVVRYPFVPPGRHVLTVLAYNELTHRWSDSAILVVNVAFPWWRRWWSETIWIALAAGLAYGLMRLRLHAVLAKQAELKRHVAAATEEIRYQAMHDSLTGLLNRSAIEARLAAKLATGRVGDEMVVALLDIDHFKRINDNQGHLGGDDVLRALGRLIARAVRSGEYAGRYGGEEILLVLDDTDGSGAERVLDLHLAIRHDTFRAAGTPIHVTCSIGLAWAAPGDDWESLVGRADDALYEAKEGGRDRVVESRRVNPNFSVASARRSGPDTPRRPGGA